MAYATRPMHDADSHIMEPPAWLEGHLARRVPGPAARCWAPPTRRARRPSTSIASAAPHADPEYRAEDASQIMLRKNFAATGSFIEDDRPRALELLGFASQLVFDTFTSSHVLRLERDGDPSFAIEVARGPAPGDARVVLGRPAPAPGVRRAARRHGRPRSRSTREAIDGGAAALQIGQYCPPGHSPSHVDLEPVWAMAAEAGVPVVLHVAGAGANVMNPKFFENGLPPVPDFHGGDGNFKSIDYLSIPLPVMQTLNALVIDGVLQRHPDLRVGVIEVGASWIPSWMRMLDSAHEAFRKNEERLQRMDDAPERVRAPPGARRRRTRTRTPAGRSPTRAPRCACSPPTSRTWKAAATRSAASSAAWTPRAPTTTRAGVSTGTTSSTCSAPCSSAAASPSSNRPDPRTGVTEAAQSRCTHAGSRLGFEVAGVSKDGFAGGAAEGAEHGAAGERDQQRVGDRAAGVPAERRGRRRTRGSGGGSRRPRRPGTNERRVCAPSVNGQNDRLSRKP